jgi:hypothetical protein
MVLRQSSQKYYVSNIVGNNYNCIDLSMVGVSFLGLHQWLVEANTSRKERRRVTHRPSAGSLPFLLLLKISLAHLYPTFRLQLTKVVCGKSGAATTKHYLNGVPSLNLDLSSSASSA